MLTKHLMYVLNLHSFIMTLPLSNLCSSCCRSKPFSHSGEVLVSPIIFTDPLKWLQHRVDGSHGSVSNMTLRLKRSLLTTSPLSCRQHTSPVSAIFNGSLELWQVALGLSLPHTTVVITLITARSLNQYATVVDRTPCLLTCEGHSTLDVHPGWRCSRERGTPSECDTQDVLRIRADTAGGGQQCSSPEGGW